MFCRDKYKGAPVTWKGVVSEIDMEPEHFVVSVRMEVPGQGFFANVNGAEPIIKVVASQRFQATLLRMEPPTPISFDGHIVNAGSAQPTIRLAHLQVGKP